MLNSLARPSIWFLLFSPAQCTRPPRIQFVFCKNRILFSIPPSTPPYNDLYIEPVGPIELWAFASYDQLLLVRRLESMMYNLCPTILWAFQSTICF